MLKCFPMCCIYIRLTFSMTTNKYAFFEQNKIVPIVNMNRIVCGAFQCIRVYSNNKIQLDASTTRNLRRASASNVLIHTLRRNRRECVEYIRL